MSKNVNEELSDLKSLINEISKKVIDNSVLIDENKILINHLSQQIKSNRDVCNALNYTLLLIEPNHVGHSPNYVKTIGRHFLSMGFNLVTLTPFPVEIENFLLPIAKEADVQLNNYFYTQIEPKNKKRCWEALRLLIGNLDLFDKVDLAFFPSIDYFIHPSLEADDCHLESIIWGGIYMGASYHRIPDKEKWLIQREKCLSSDKCKFLYIVDPQVLGNLKSKFFNKGIYHIPDFTEVATDRSTTTLVENIFRHKNNRFVIGLAGSLGRWKGVMTFIEYIKLLPEKLFYFVLAGKLNTQTFSENELAIIQDFADNLPDNVFFFPEIISKSEGGFNALIKGFDAIFLGYFEFPQSSNLLSKAAKLQIPVIASDRFFIGEAVKNYELGVTFDSNDINDAVKATFYLKDNLELIKNNAKFYDYCDNFVDGLDSSLSKITEIVEK
ncbi:glycosyltransferase [Okeania sp.]|uniref:glycosyltransferase n=1 Tax=Okeania sp. TaxID=3100323 RepID=UPI002B4B8389|nr:glycosyltransferase [Okeania sp.]MEB3341633.1 glycosyltransferase [Okeania sp.]